MRSESIPSLMSHADSLGMKTPVKGEKIIMDRMVPSLSVRGTLKKIVMTMMPMTQRTSTACLIKAKVFPFRSAIT